MDRPELRNRIRDPRELALRCFLEVERQRLLVPDAMRRLDFEMEESDRALAHEIVYGTFRFLPGLERVLAGFMRKPKAPAAIRWLLLSSLYQMGYLRVPDYAVLNEANKLATKFKLSGLKGLVNGVLRNAARSGQELWADQQQPDWLLPPWLLERFATIYGTQTLATWSQSWQEPAVSSYWTVADSPLKDDDLSPNLPHAYRRQKPIAPGLLHKFKAYIQNETSQLLAEIVVRSGARSVLDLCAAPGGKACYIAAFGRPDRLLACDPSAARVARMIENRDRLGLDFEIRETDAENLAEPPQSFDCVLVDAPCSGLGILGRHPEIKYLKSGVADEGLRQLQANLMNIAWSWVKPGGFLLYAVCSLDSDEVPAPIPEAVPAESEVIEWSPPGLMIQQGHRFFVAPTPTFDGFQAQLLRKG